MQRYSHWWKQTSISKQ